jgi:N-acyl-D-amino-acid deacylase
MTLGRTILPLAMAWTALAVAHLSSQPITFVIAGAQLADGSGAPLQLADVRVDGDTIVAVGDAARRPGDLVVDGAGKVLAPGFIDAHNHSTEGLEREREALTQVSQGITTVAVGQDGSSPWPIAGYIARLRAAPPAVNVVVLAGHATIRTQVMGQDYKRRSRPAEVARMRTLVDRAMAEGAFGLSSGLEYEVGSYADVEEVIEMARAAAAIRGYYISHIRDEADLSMDAIREAIAIGERARLPVQITHLKLGTVGVWGKAMEVVALVEAARKRGVDVTADAYPYLAWQSTPKVLVPNRKYDDPVSVKRGLDDIGGAGNVQITRWGAYPQYVGKRLDEMARAEGLTDIEAYVRFASDDQAGMIGHAMIEADLKTFYQQPWVMVASDGGIANNHPRGAGTFPRVLGRYVREQAWLTLPEAIRKMTAMPAARIGLQDRGHIAPGMKADLVLFDPMTVVDRSTFEQPRALASGISRVWVNGQLVWNGTAAAGPLPGRVLSRRADRP